MLAIRVATSPRRISRDDWRTVSLTYRIFATQGQPSAVFVSDQCDINAHFGAHNIIINLTFCAYIIELLPLAALIPEMF